MLSLNATAHGDWYDAIRRVRAAVNGCGFVLEEHPFSGLMMNFRLELFPTHIRQFSGALDRHAIFLDSESGTQLAQVAGTNTSVETGAIDAMLVVSFPDGDPEMRHIVPAVPG